jgi:hypothetical protein
MAPSLQTGGTSQAFPEKRHPLEQRSTQQMLRPADGLATHAPLLHSLAVVQGEPGRNLHVPPSQSQRPPKLDAGVHSAMQSAAVAHRPGATHVPAGKLGS